MKYIPLTGSRGKGLFAIVDDDNYEYLNQWRWQLSRFGYVKRSPNVRINGIRATRYIAMHSLVIERIGKLDIDHKNRNKLDNRRSNLRLATRGQNRANSALIQSASGYRGVIPTRNKNTEYQWQAQIQFDKHKFYLGKFTSRELAAKAYNTAAIKYHGEFATLNVV